MSDRMQIDDQLSVGGQPSESEIRSLAEDGFKSVVNFRTAGEDDQPLSPDSEESSVLEAGMSYLHVPVSMESMDEATVNRFRQQLKSLPKPVFAHCKTGKRAGAMTMMHVAVEKGMSGEQALKRAEEMGFECDVPELKEFVSSYVNNQAS